MNDYLSETTNPQPLLGRSLIGSSAPFAQGSDHSPAEREILSLLLDRYLEAMEKGELLSVEELTQDCPNLRGTLSECVAGLVALQEMAKDAKVGPNFGEVGATLAFGTPLQQDFQLGDFVLHEVIGQGGMGIVYRATQKSLHRTVALKVLPMVKALTHIQMLRFQREAELAASLQHPNIIPVYAFGSEAGLHYYAMQRIEGYSLDQWAINVDEQFKQNGEHLDKSEMEATPRGRSRGSLPSWREAIQLVVQAADGLHSAHEAGIVHRDIKPSNLLVNHEGKLWIADFGLARMNNDSSLTRSGDLVGTMRYMSPEQARGNSATVDGRSDVYSLGATLYELLAGRPAFDSNDTVDLLRSISQDEPSSLRQYRCDLPKSLDAVLRKAMSKKRDARYETAAAFRDDLQRVLEGKPTEAKMPSYLDRVQQFIMHHRNGAAAAAVAVLMLVLGLAINSTRLQLSTTIAEENAKKAKQNEIIARDAVERLGRQVAEDLATIPGAHSIRRKLLDGTLKYYEGLVEVADDKRALDGELARTFAMIGALRLELGAAELAIPALEESVRLYQAKVDLWPAAHESQLQLAISLNNLARAHAVAGDLRKCRELYARALSIETQVWKGGNSQVAPELATTHNNLGLLLSSQADKCDAVAQFRQGLEILGSSSSYELLRASIQANLASVLAEHAPQEVETVAREALQVLEPRLDEQPNDLDLANKTINTLNALGLAYCSQKEYGSAVGYFSKASDWGRRKSQEWPKELRIRQHYVISLNHLGVAHCQNGEWERGGFYLELAEKEQKDLLLDSSFNAAALKCLGDIKTNLGSYHRQQGNLREFDACRLEAQQLREELDSMTKNEVRNDGDVAMPVSLKTPNIIN
jgi:eukaryotic-like serine/threonine-protein kinase